ncbi:MAG: hypothetical protein WDN00_17110 [Limisphaerales bacterium]
MKNFACGYFSTVLAQFAVSASQRATMFSLLQQSVSPGALAAGADDGDVQLAVEILSAQQRRHSEDHRAGGERCGLEKVTAVPADAFLSSW